MQTLLFIIVAIIGIFLILLLGNLRVGSRQYQYWNPILAFVLVLTFLHEYFDSFELIKAGEYLLGFQKDYAELMFSLIGVGIYATIKMLLNQVGYFFVNKKEDEAISIPKLSLAYKLDKNEDVVLRREWVFPSLFFKYFSYTLGALFLAILALKIFLVEYEFVMLYYIPSLVAFSLLISLEIFWYLQHDKVEEQQETIEEKVNKDSIPEDYEKLWEEYQVVWKNKLSLAWKYEQDEHEKGSPTAIHIVEAQNLINAGYSLSVNDYHIIEHLTKRNDMLIDDVITDKVAPLLFTAFLRRLMDGENVLVITAKRCYENSEYHKKIVTWINEWFFKLTTNRDFWKVQVFSRTKDVELASRIIISSADDILEKNIVNHVWFDNLKTVLFLNGEEIFSESLTSNNILLNILRNKNKQIQSVVLSQYREALQSSVMRNLDVKSDLKEVRSERFKPKRAFTIFWKLEGNQLFQHQVLSGHIEKYLGAEAVLSLLPRRERIKNLTMVGQEKLPYYEYLEELDNNTNSLLDTPVSARMLKYKGVNEVEASDVTFLLEQKESSFMFARDRHFNAITTLKQWETYATENVFVHVVSSPYLLLDYLIDHAEYFYRTPLYALSSKMMISRFEVARTLLERMITQELSETAILEELNWINPNAIFVKHELHQLFQLAFGIDIVASNYLSIKTTYEFNKAANQFEQITKYRLQAKIKENINLSFLHNVEIVDQAKNVLKITSNDLVFQNYLPDQIHAFNGKPYNIRGFDHHNYKLRTNHRSPVPSVMQRRDMQVVLHKFEKPLTESHKKQPNNDVYLALCEGTFDIVTKGYFNFKTAFSLERNGFTYTAINEAEVPTRSYPLGRFVILNIEANKNYDVPKVTATLQVLLTEVMFTLFPETHQYIVITAAMSQLVLNNWHEKLYATLKDSQGGEIEVHNTVQICIFEDAHQDLGLIQSIYDKWDFILRLLDDYLMWLQDEHSRTKASKKEEKEDKNASKNKARAKNVFRKTNIDKTAYLRYANENLPEFMDIEGTSRLLRRVLGNNYMTSQRGNFYK
ncbi:MAG: hypothetical protein ACPG5B_15830 [Chitinophagales bacterium]